jgi:Phage integrase, N-terminal SAM-like domain
VTHLKRAMLEELQRRNYATTTVYYDLIRERVARGELHLQSADERQTLSAYAKVWLETVQGSLKASTVRFYEGNLEQHIVPALGPGLWPRSDVRIAVS